MFDPQTVQVFRFVSCAFDEASGTAVFSYAFDDDHHFSETYVFPVPDTPLEPEVRSAVDRALLLLSLVAGISYFKAAVPPVISVESGAITEDQARYLETLYFEGLGEFSYVNQLSLRGRTEWRYQHAVSADAPSLDLARRSLVAVGGGKDSCVSIEALRERDEDVLLASVNQPKAVMQCIKASGLPAVHASRTLAPLLGELNASGAYNGHVPVTAIVSLALVVTALLQNCDAVVMSNERSASSGNLEWEGREVNHQWSKSLDAESALASVVMRSVAADLEYFSLLRPFSELDIARRFAAIDRYDSAFTSCNRAFRIEARRRADTWCCDCDKCRFVFLALAPFTSPKRLKKIFGRDLLEDVNQQAGFEALCGWHAEKPFECVGEIEESIAAFLLLSESAEWRERRVVQHLASILSTLDLPADIRTRPFAPSADHRLPERYADLAGASLAHH